MPRVDISSKYCCSVVINCYFFLFSINFQGVRVHRGHSVSIQTKETLLNISNVAENEKLLYLFIVYKRII